MAACAVLAVVAGAAVFAGVSEDVVRRNGAEQVDGARLDWIARHRSAPLVGVSRFLNDAGAVGVVVALAVLVGLLLWWRRVPLAAALAPLFAVGAAGVVAAAVKLIVDRSRPPAAVRLLAETDPSFPSGHATGTMALGIATALVVCVYLLRRPLARAVTLAVGAGVPLAVAASRLELGVHWPTDVVAGVALGFTAAVVTVGAAVVIARGNADPSAGPRWWTRIARVLSSRRSASPIRGTAAAIAA